MSDPSTPRAVVIGSGLAGLSCTLELVRAGWHVVVVSAGRAGRDGCSHRVHALAPWVLLTAPWAHGDSPARLLADLKRLGGGLQRDELAEVLAEHAHQAAVELCDALDLAPLEGGPVVLAGDSHPRGLRCLPRTREPVLGRMLRECVGRGVVLRERTLALGLVTSARRVAGLVALERASGVRCELGADAVVLACGGPGAVFPCTTAPRWCRGSGLALGAAVGALLHHPELTQAIPVTATPPLYFPSTAALLAGRILVDERPLASQDLDTATRAIATALQQGLAVALDPANGSLPLLPARVRESPTFRREGRVPLAVALHHGVGGVAIDAWGRTSVPGLYACGEAAGGIQGARRMMGTGLLEARIFGRRAGLAAAKDFARFGPAAAPEAWLEPPLPADPRRLEERLDALMGPLAAVRPRDAVATTLAELEAWPAADAAEQGEAAALAALRREAALAILRSCA